MNKIKIENGVVVDIRPAAEAPAEYVNAPSFVRYNDTTPDNGVTFYRNGELLKAPVPAEVPLWAFRASLVLGGITEAQVDTLIASLPDPAKTVATIQWNYGNFIERGHALINQLGAAMGLTSDQIDDVFRTASTLQ